MHSILRITLAGHGGRFVRSKIFSRSPTNSTSATDQGREYSIAKGYDVIKNKGDKIHWHCFVWNKHTVPKHSFLTWIYMHNALNTNAKLHRLGISEDDTCAICGNGPETSSHLFFECEYNSKVISLIGSLIGETIPSDASSDWRRGLSGPRLRKDIINAIINACLYAIWKQRNLSKHDLILITPSKLVNMIIKEVMDRTLRFRENLGLRDNDLLERLQNRH
ncbi:uncharacterized protein LOC141648976 [Silene latifolia]|uniref:uncharacterized protein LOC141648976 n=1 Tax=Silene latifolia TaxID=37657 RepID=UPI003D7732A5